jgi:hypothetical protein
MKNRIALSTAALSLILSLAACVDTGAVADDAPDDAAPTDAEQAIDATPTIDAPAVPSAKTTIILFVREYNRDGDEVGCNGDLRLLVEGQELEPLSCAPLAPDPEDRFGTTVFRYLRPRTYARLDASIVSVSGSISPPEFVIPLISFFYPQGAPPESWHFLSVQRL